MNKCLIITEKTTEEKKLTIGIITNKCFPLHIKAIIKREIPTIGII